MPVTRDEVVWAYRMFFGRDPESENAILTHMGSEDQLSLRKRFACSTEFSAVALPLAQQPGSFGSLPLDVPKIEVDTDAGEEQLSACIAKIKDAWAHLGIVKPHFSVLTDQQFLPENLNGSIDKFWASGEREAAKVERILERYDFSPLSEKTCVEYGCGVGRVTTALARRFARVHGYDISQGHLACAEERARETGADNVEFHLCSETFLQRLHKCDFFYSSIVFQHNPPPVIKKLIRNALRALNPGGIAIFQVPTYSLNYRFDTAEWLETDHALEMQMHCLPQKTIFEVIAEEDCTLLEVREDNRTGAPNQFISNTFIIRGPDVKTNGASKNGSGVRPWRLFRWLYADECLKAAYRGILGRDPDPEGLGANKVVLDRSRDLEALTAGLIHSEEFWERALAERAPDLVSAACRGLLEREPEPEELSNNAAAISSSRGLAALCRKIVRSDEFWKKLIALRAPDLVRAIYIGLLGREPDKKGMAAYASALSESGEIAAVSEEIVRSNEFWEKIIASRAPGLVRAVHAGLLGRDPDKKETAGYAAELSKTRKLDAVADKIIHSGEFRDRFIAEHSADFVSDACRGLLGRDPGPKEMSTCAAYLKKSKNLADILPAIATFDKPCPVFLHIQKTAGTSIQNHLEDSFGPEDVYREHGDTLYRRSPGELSRYSVFAGHFNYESLRLIPRNSLSVFTFVREPKERLLSLYHFWRAHKPDHPSNSGGVETANELMIEDFFEAPRERMAPAIWNHMTWAIMGAGQWRKWQSILTGETDGDAAARIIDTEIRPEILQRLDEFAFIGLQEDFDTSVEALFRILGKQPPVVKRADHSLEKLMKEDTRFKKTMERQPMTPRLDAALDSLVELDNIVHEGARDLYPKRLAELGLR